MYIIVSKSGNYTKVWSRTTSLFNALNDKKKIKKENNFISVKIKKI